MSTVTTSAGSSGNIVSSNVAKAPKGKLTAKSTESQALVLANEARIGLYVFNPSAKEVWLALGTTAVAEEGIWLKKESGQVFIQGYKGQVSVITTAEEGSVTFAEI